MKELIKYVPILGEFLQDYDEGKKCHGSIMRRWRRGKEGIIISRGGCIEGGCSIVGISMVSCSQANARQWNLCSHTSYFYRWWGMNVVVGWGKESLHSNCGVVLVLGEGGGKTFLVKC